MRSKAKMLVVAILALAALGLGAQTASAPVTLNVYMQIDLADPQYAYWPVTLEAFQKKYPNIKLEFEYVTGEQFHQNSKPWLQLEKFPIYSPVMLVLAPDTLSTEEWSKI